MSDMGIENTSFASHVGLYKLLKMPYGLTNVPATFKCLMEKVFKRFIWQKCLIYLDDLIVFGDIFQETLEKPYGYTL